MIPAAETRSITKPAVDPCEGNLLKNCSFENTPVPEGNFKRFDASKVEGW